MVKVRASQIFSHAMEDVVAAKKELDAGTPFTEVVEKYSTCPSKQNGGDLGWMPEDALQSLMGEEVSEKDKGKIIGPVHSQYGYHILMVSEIEVEKVEGPFKADTPMKEMNQLWPEAHTHLFKQFHIGLPVTGYKGEETIASTCSDQNKSVTEVLNFLNREYFEKSIAVISPEELDMKIQNGSTQLVLLDIRESWERDISKIEGSHFITSENSETLINSFAKDNEVVLIDWKQDRSPSFLKWLRQKGFTNVKCLEGGIDAWSENVNTRLNRYDIDEDDGYRYEDIIEEPEDHKH
jgi:rhodanese-related sulfurtransferase